MAVYVRLWMKGDEILQTRYFIILCFNHFNRKMYISSFHLLQRYTLATLAPWISNVNRWMLVSILHFTRPTNFEIVMSPGPQLWAPFRRGTQSPPPPWAGTREGHSPQAQLLRNDPFLDNPRTFVCNICFPDRESNSSLGRDSRELERWELNRKYSVALSCAWNLHHYDCGGYWRRESHISGYLWWFTKS